MKLGWVVAAAVAVFWASTVRADTNMMMIPAEWRHELYSTHLAGAKQNERRIISYIMTGSFGVDQVVKYDQEVDVDTFDKPFTVSTLSPDKKNGESLTVTLHATADPRKMKAEFEHIVYENGEMKLKFSGLTTLIR